MHTVQFLRTLTRNERKYANKKESGTALTTRKAPFTARNPRFVPKEQGEKRTGKERERDTGTRAGFEQDARFFLGD